MAKKKSDLKGLQVNINDVDEMNDVDVNDDLVCLDPSYRDSAVPPHIFDCKYCEDTASGPYGCCGTIARSKCVVVDSCVYFVMNC